MNDEALMLKIGRGEVKLLAILFERHHRKLYNYFLRLTCDRGASEDLTQEVFFRILKYRHSFRDESKFTTWMYKIGRNVHIDNFHKHKKEVPLEDQWAEEAAPDAPPQDLAQRDQENKYLQKALSFLPPGKREVLLLSRFQGLKYKEIAELLGCTTAAVKVKVHRAIKDLRQNYLNLKCQKQTSPGTNGGNYERPMSTN